MGYIVVSLVYPTADGALYGTRLKNNADFPITNDMVETLKSNIKENEIVKEVTYSLSGKIINIIVILDDDIPITEGQELEEDILSSFEEEIKSYYDFQLFLTSETLEYPAIGYKHHTTENFIWTNNNVKVSNE
jgi:hypothetical protein